MMNCEQVKELLGPLLDGELPQEVADAVDAHLGSCALCHEEAATLEQSCDFLRRVGPVEPPDDLFEKVLEKATPNRPAFRVLRSLSLRAAVVLLGALGVGFGWSQVLPDGGEAERNPRPLAGVLQANRAADGIATDFRRLQQRPEGSLLAWAVSQEKKR